MESLDPDIAEVDGNGLVTGKGRQAVQQSGNCRRTDADYEIRVQEIKLTDFTLNKTETTLHRGESDKLTGDSDPR